MSGSDSANVVECRACRGSGNCPRCGGEGRIVHVHTERTALPEDHCLRCGGNGICTGCQGRGRIIVPGAAAQPAGQQADTGQSMAILLRVLERIEKLGGRPRRRPKRHSSHNTNNKRGKEPGANGSGAYLRRAKRWTSWD